jgi:RNA polymerase sigma factor (TIGR02999 family)
MPSPSDEPVTELLRAMDRGEPDAWSRLLPLVDRQLRRLADARLGRTPGSSLQVTDLVHETFLQMMQRSGGSWNDRRHFYGVAAHAMHGLLVDRARRATAAKRGGERQTLSLHDEPAAVEPPALEMLALHDALRKLADIDRQQHEIVMLRYFAGLSIDEVAQALDVSASTIDRQWRFARAWLQRTMAGEPPPRPQ